MNTDQPILTKARPDPDIDMQNTVMVEQEKFDAPLGRYIDLLGQHPFERDVITSHKRVKNDLARFWPKTNDDGRQARRLWNMIDNVVQDMPQTTEQILVRVSSSRTRLMPTALPVPTEKAVLATFDTKENTLVRYDVPPDSDGAIMADMGIPSGLMVLCQPLLPLQNAFRDSRPMGMGGASVFNVNEKDKPDMDARDLVLNPPDTSLPALRSPNLPPVPPYLTRIDYPYGLYVRDENGGHPILKAEAAAIAAGLVFQEEEKLRNKKFHEQQQFFQKRDDDEKRRLTVLQEAQKREDDKKGGMQSLNNLAKLEVATQAELLQANNGQPKRPDTVIVPIIPVPTEQAAQQIGDQMPEGLQSLAVAIPNTSTSGYTDFMPISQGAAGPANAAPAYPARINPAFPVQDTDELESGSASEDAPNTVVTPDVLATVEQASNEILVPATELADGQVVVNAEAGQNTSTGNEPNAQNVELVEPRAASEIADNNTQIVAEPYQEPVTNEPVVVEPRVNEAVVNEPVATETVANEPTINEPVTNEPRVNEPVTNEPTTNEPVTNEPTINEPTANEPARNQASGNENTSPDNNTQQPDQNASQDNQQTRNEDTQDNRQSEANQGNDNRNDNTNENRNDEPRNEDRSDDNRQDSQQDNPRDESRDEGRREEPDSSRDEGNDRSGNDRQEQQSSSHDETRGREGDDNNDNQNQNSGNPAHDIFHAVDLFPHHAVAHADIMHGVHSDIRNGAIKSADWVTMPTAHAAAGHSFGNSMLHTHSAAMAAPGHVAMPGMGTAHASASAAAVKGTVKAATTKTAPGTAMHSVAANTKTNFAGLGILPFALTKKSGDPASFVTSQRNQQWQDFKKKEAAQHNYTSPPPGLHHPEAHIPHEDLKPDM